MGRLLIGEEPELKRYAVRTAPLVGEEPEEPQSLKNHKKVVPKAGIEPARTSRLTGF